MQHLLRIQQSLIHLILNAFLFYINLKHVQIPKNTIVFLDQMY